MKTIIVDDQYENKAQVIAAILKKIGVDNVDLVAGAKEALRKMRREKYDLLILDLQIPAEVGASIDPSGGRALLEYIGLSSDIHKPTGVLGVTAHSDSYEQCESFFRERGWVLVLGVEDVEYLESILLTQKAHLMSHTTQFDIAIITALEHTELEAVRRLPCGWQTFRQPDDFSVYYTGEVRTKDGAKKTIIATSLPRMGMASAASVTAKVCLKFRPKLLVMTGIAAGVKGEVALGDIMVADPSWDWGSGKLTIRKGKVTFLGEPTQIPLDPSIASVMRSIAVERTYLDEIYAGFKLAKRPPHDLNMHVGPVTSGAVVLEDPETVALIQSQHRKTIGVEMEAYGVMSAAFHSGPNAPKTVVIKSVCDFADPLKNNEWQGYAAYTSAQMAFRYITDHFFS
ncbi:response regulator [Paraburkholderia sp. RP-4-7]|uniref:Response regulator n=1 Tax=Paraburkholderia polaris TaxID=2728848 RepID=A0A848IX59_9BURK|nr:response regulator [Paraburkholderia polaris]NMM03547.1 response regulator [Paraburkholderia polaris]